MQCMRKGERDCCDMREQNFMTTAKLQKRLVV